MDGMQEHARALADGIEAALGGWVVRCVASRSTQPDDPGSAPDQPPALAPALLAEAEAAGRAATAEVGPRVRALLEADIDEQRTTPLALVREAVSYPTEVLRRAGVPAVRRDSHQAALMPDDPYDLAPASFADIDSALAEPGIRWGAAKAYVHINRHGGGRQR